MVEGGGMPGMEVSTDFAAGMPGSTVTRSVSEESSSSQSVKQQMSVTTLGADGAPSKTVTMTKEAEAKEQSAMMEKTAELVNNEGKRDVLMSQKAEESSSEQNESSKVEVTMGLKGSAGFSIKGKGDSS